HDKQNASLSRGHLQRGAGPAIRQRLRRHQPLERWTGAYFGRRPQPEPRTSRGHRAISKIAALAIAHRATFGGEAIRAEVLHEAEIGGLAVIGAKASRVG